MVKGKTPKKKINKNKLGVKNKKKSKKVIKRARYPDLSLLEQALRGSPDMDKLLRKNNGELYVPPDYPEKEGVAVAASAQPKTKADVIKFLGNLKQNYPVPLVAEHAWSDAQERRSSRPPTPVVSFGDYMKQQEAATKREKQNELFLNDFAGTTFDTDNSKNDFTFSFPGEGGKRKSRRRRKKSRRRRKTKKKSRRRRK